MGTSALRKVGTRQPVAALDSLYPVAEQVICSAKKLRSYLLAEFIVLHTCLWSIHRLLGLTPLPLVNHESYLYK